MTPHNSGAWQKKVRGKIRYFGRWGRVVDGRLERLPGDEWWKPALELWKLQKDDLLAGVEPATVPDEEDSERLTLKELANRFLTSKKRKLDAGELSIRSFEDYQKTCQGLLDFFGRQRTVPQLRPQHFEELRASFAEKWGPVRLGNEITRVKTVFRYAYDSDLIDRPVKFGGEFRKPDQKTYRKHKASSVRRFFEAHEIRAMLEKAKPSIKAMILLGVNCGYGPEDCGRLTKESIDFERREINFARSKTGVMRKNPIWPETVSAIQEAISPDPDQPLAFVTARGQAWTDGRNQMISEQMRFVMNDAGCYVRGRNHYALRHNLETIGGETRDQVAVDYLMGHIDRSMAATYREQISDERLSAVSDHVRTWLFGDDEPS